MRPAFEFHDCGPAPSRFLDDVLSGLARPQKSIPAKYFYDARGSALFERICELPEYYPTRTELAIMRDHARDMAQALGPDCMLIEYGCGSARKTRLLLDELAARVFMPVDISREQLHAASVEIAAAYPALAVIAVCGDYTRIERLPECPRPVKRRVVYFPGSTIGNLTPDESVGLLRHVAVTVGRGGAMLVGVDLKKPEAVLNAAYNDSAGVTAQFNLNLLTRLRDELGAHLDVGGFRHHAFYDGTQGRVEMHLISERRQELRVAGHSFEFDAGERLHTENSYKYDIAEFQALARLAGFVPAQVWTDADRLFAVHYLALETASAGL